MREYFGDRLKILRLEKNMTQDELAKILNTGKASISHYESNRRIPDLNTIEQLSEFFNVSIDYLSGKSNIRNPYDNKDENINNIDGDIAAHLDGKEFSEDDKKQILSFIDFINSKNNE